MSKNKKTYRRQQGRKGFPWLFLALGGGLLVFATFVFANRSGEDDGGTPSMKVDQQKIDYGYVKFGEDRSFTVKVSNTGNGTLRFNDKPYIEVLEGC